DRGAFEPVELNAVVLQTVELFRAALPRARVEVRMRLGAGARVLGSPRLLEQVLLNLFLNAGQARPTGLVLTVSTEVLAAAEAAPFASLAAGEAVRLRVADNGPGFAPEARARLFEAFATSKDDGTGIGLSLSRRIVSAHGGRIDADEAPAGGARFTIVLPAIEPAPAPAAPPPAFAAQAAEPARPVLPVEAGAVAAP
ncbi:MAG TPA: ATP-binding protein, partial [Planctomycetota bacterium]|nr:ATP-binding protein [Planctomycetota bacterium]